MPLPQEVINRLSDERPESIGWSAGLLWFACGIFAVTLILYIGIVIAYEPAVNNQANAVGAQLATVSKSVDVGQEAALAASYSQVVHVQSLLKSHIAFSQTLTWLARNTEANVYFSSLLFSSGNQLTLTALGRSEADINQQLAVFESDPNVSAVNVSNVSIASVSGFWQANITLILKPALLAANTQ